jgi:hypothetical protein
LSEGSGLELSLFEVFFFDYGQAVRSRIPGGIHHGTSRGNARLPIFKDDQDRHRFLAIFQEVVERFEAILSLHLEYGCSLSEIAHHVGCYYTTIIKIITNFIKK